MAPPTTAKPSSITLRFKHRRSTTLLHADPLASFLILKRELIRALYQTHPSGKLPTGATIPQEPLDILLARPRDIHDVSLGWTRLRTEDEGSGPVAETDDVKTPMKRGPPAKKTALSVGRPDCPRAAGLKDGGVLAYKFRSESIVEGDANQGVQAFDDDDEEMDGEEDDAEEWDVVIASYEDTTGTVNEGDVGGMPTFEG